MLIWLLCYVLWSRTDTKCLHSQVKLLIKLAAAKVAGEASGSKVLSDLIGELEDPAISSELRFKINQNHSDIGSG